MYKEIILIALRGMRDRGDITQTDLKEIMTDLNVKIKCNKYRNRDEEINQCFGEDKPDKSYDGVELE